MPFESFRTSMRMNQQYSLCLPMKKVCSPGHAALRSYFLLLQEVRSPWISILCGLKQRYPIATLAFCGPKSAGYEHLSALLLKPLWDVRKPQAPPSFGLNYLLYQNSYGLSRLENLLFKTSVPSKGWGGMLVGCLLWAGDCYEPPLALRGCM